MSYRIGIDLGGTNIKAGVVDDTYRIVAAVTCKTKLPRPSDAIIADMAAMARQAVREAGLTFDDIVSVGVGSPGSANPQTGVVEYTSTLQFHHVPVGEALGGLLGKPVYLENDANAAAYGEAIAGAGRGAESCVCITLGTGVGGGIVLDGRIYSGYNHAGAELGHTVIQMGGELCTCGRHGCWEAYASATALIQQTRAVMERYLDSRMWALAEQEGHVSGRTAFAAAKQGDAPAQEVLDAYIRYVGCGLVNMINVFQPEVLCIGGGVCKEGETLLAPLRAMIEAERYSKNSAKQTRLCAAALGNGAGTIGAAFLDRALS